MNSTGYRSDATRGSSTDLVSLPSCGPVPTDLEWKARQPSLQPRGEKPLSIDGVIAAIVEVQHRTPTQEAM